MIASKHRYLFLRLGERTILVSCSSLPRKPRTKNGALVVDLTYEEYKRLPREKRSIRSDQVELCTVFLLEE